MSQRPLHSWFAQISNYFLEIWKDDPLKRVILILSFSPAFEDSRRQVTDSFAQKMHKTLQVALSLLLV